MKKALLFSLLIFGILILGCSSSSSKKSCKTNGDCEDWRECNATSSLCITKKGYCESDASCASGTVCNKQHRCELKGGVCNSTEDCENWQICDNVLGRCMTKIGFCADSSFCANDWEVCNVSTHECVPDAGSCVDNFDCRPHQLCNEAKRRCYPLPGRCDTDISCERWQYCDGETNKCALKPGLCDADSSCMGGEYCEPESHRCMLKKLTEAEKILVPVKRNGTLAYSLVKEGNWKTVGSSYRGGIAEIPLEKTKTLVIIDCNATMEAASPGVAEAQLFTLLRPEVMRTVQKGLLTEGGDVPVNLEYIPITPEPTGVVRLDSYGGELMLSMAHWHPDANERADYEDWQPNKRKSLSSFGIKEGDKFRIIAEFDSAYKPGRLTTYIENNKGIRTKLSTVNYTTYVNAEGKDSVAAAVGVVWHGGPYTTRVIGITLDPWSAGWAISNISYAPGQCSEDGQCNQWELCNPITHMCYLKLGWCQIDTDCPAGYNCSIDPRTEDRRICTPIACGRDIDCPGSTCNIEMHLCRPVPPYCGPNNYTCFEAPRKCVGENKCAPWEDCDGRSGLCVTKMGMCGSDMDCPIGALCELNPGKQNSHVCKPMVCNTDSDCPGTTCDTYYHQCRQRNP